MMYPESVPGNWYDFTIVFNALFSVPTWKCSQGNDREKHLYLDTLRVLLHGKTSSLPDATHNYNEYNEYITHN